MMWILTKKMALILSVFALATIVSAEPTAISGLATWWDSSTGVTADGSGNVENWMDRSGNNAQMNYNGGTKATTSGPALNGHVTLKWLDGYYYCINSALDFNAGITFFYVIKPSSADGGMALFSRRWGSNPQDTWLDLVLSNGVPAQVEMKVVQKNGATVTATPVKTGANVVTGGWQIFQFTIDPANRIGKIIVDGVEQASVALPNSNPIFLPADPTTINCKFGHWDWIGMPNFTGAMAEVIIYNRALTGPEQANVGNYLNTKYVLGIVDYVPVKLSDFSAE